MPFCPNCRYEFHDWVKVCPDCGTDLVAELPRVPKLVMDKLITVETFSHPEEAYLSQALLETENIQSFVFDDHIITLGRVYDYVIGGVKVKVRERDAKDAIQILQSVKTRVTEYPIDYGEICPRCGSSYTHYERFAVSRVYLCWFLTWLIFGNGSYGLPGGVLFPFLKKRWKCNNCGFKFKTEEGIAKETKPQL
jgi:rubredoxin